MEPEVTVYDNEGRTIDRYTVIIGTTIFNMSLNALSPQGVNIYCRDLDEDEGADEFTHCGRNIPLEMLPEEVRRAIAIRVAEISGDPIGEEL